MEEKREFCKKLEKQLKEYPNVVLVTGDYVNTKYLQEIRKELRGIAILVFGKILL
jgi:ribosomal protein L10